MQQRLVETIFVTILFILYIVLWKLKRNSQIKATGKDPEVISKAQSNIQKYMSSMFGILTKYALLIIVLHAINFQYYSLFSRLNLLNLFLYNILGFAIGLFGLGICLYAQTKMGNAWRVGIDENDKPKLINTGLYKIIRNPTYLGLFILNLGVWIIWPTWTVFILNLLFIFSLEFQVRCEEDFLEKTVGEEYILYKKNTWRYIPFIY